MRFWRKREVNETEMHRQIRFPFRGGFPRSLGVVVMRTVADGTEPARAVYHYPDNSWAITDGVGDPNEPGAAIVEHMWHLVEADPSLAELASLPLGHAAHREDRDDPWWISDADYEPEE